MTVSPIPLSQVPRPPATRAASPAVPLLIDVDTRGDVAVLHLRGALVTAAARRAREAMSRALEGAPREVVVDLSGVTSADGSGAVLLVAMRRHARRSGSALRLVGAGDAVRQALHGRGVSWLLDGRGAPA